MRTRIIKAPVLKSNPYDEDISGFHDGDTVQVDCEHLKFSILERPSGLGPSYKIFVDTKEHGQLEIATVFISDDGELIVK